MIFDIFTPKVGLEPTTSRLEVGRAIHCATRALILYTCFSILVSLYLFLYTCFSIIVFILYTIYN